jgi:hypothetical protein
MNPTARSLKMKTRTSVLVCACLVVARAGLVVANSAAPAESVPWSLETFLTRVPPLKQDASDRIPCITWEPFRATTNDRSFSEGSPLPDELYREIAKRGFTQRIPLDERYVPMAVAMQKAGLAIVFMEGTSGLGPVAPGESANHQLPVDYARAKDEPVYHCPALTAGWLARAERTRAILRKYREAGVRVTAAWMDWEEEPWPLADRWQQARACARCRTTIPAAALADFPAYAQYVDQLKRHVLSAYLAAPIREIYPDCHITNWGAVYATPERPVRSYWGNRFCANADLGLFTAANPVAYGNTIYRDMHWKREWNWPVDVAHMDRVYTEIMFAHVSGNAYNQQRIAPWNLNAPWVVRYCPDTDDETVPILFRERYREILRHVWLRGADTMQVFNALREKRLAIATEECEDVAAVYDEVLVYRDFLDRGWILNTEEPKADFDGAIWSGLRLGDRALVRAFTQGSAPVDFTVKPWGGAAAVALAAPPEGRAWMLTRTGEAVEAAPRDWAEVNMPTRKP